MGKMSDLAVLLDELAAAGKELEEWAHKLVQTASQLRSVISAGEASPQAKAPEAKPEPTPEVKPEPVKEYTKEEVRAILANLSQSGFRAETKALVKKYSDGGSLTDVPPERYPELVAEAEALNA